MTGIIIDKLPRRRSKAPVKKRKAESRMQTWEHVRYRVRHTPDYIIKGTDHIEIVVISPKREPLPITETGYLSHFITDGSCRTVELTALLVELLPPLRLRLAVEPGGEEGDRSIVNSTCSNETPRQLSHIAEDWRVFSSGSGGCGATPSAS
jgi:hypothetical protein